MARAGHEFTSTGRGTRTVPREESSQTAAAEADRRQHRHQVDDDEGGQHGRVVAVE